MLQCVAGRSEWKDHLGSVQTEKAEEGTARAVVSRHKKVDVPRAAFGPEDRAADRPDVSRGGAHDTLRVLYVVLVASRVASLRQRGPAPARSGVPTLGSVAPSYCLLHVDSAQRTVVSTPPPGHARELTTFGMWLASSSVSGKTQPCRADSVLLKHCSGRIDCPSARARLSVACYAQHQLF